jgi:hypothetical protein
VFVYHNGAESYYGVRGFRGSLRVWNFYKLKFFNNEEKREKNAKRSLGKELFQFRLF